MKLLIAFALVLAVAAPPAAADIGITSIDRSVASPGQFVRLTATGYLGPQPWRAYPIAMVSARSAPEPYACRGGYCSPRLRLAALRRAPYVFLGYLNWRPRMASDESGRGTLRFRVPRVRPGRYVFALFCESCVGGPQGSVIVDQRLALRIR